MPAGYGGQAIGGTRSRDALGGYGGGGTVSGRTGGGGLSGALSGGVKGAAYGSMLGAPGAIVGGLAGALIGGLRGGVSGGAGGGSLGPRGDRGRGGDQTIFPSLAPRAQGVPSLGTALKRYTRPDEAQAPGWMRFDNVMSPLQRRSYIATQGISGEQGLYRSQEAKDYYGNLLARTLISPTGQLGDYNQLLPIEMQYLQALGIPGWKDTAGLLGGLGIKPGMGMGG
jgi:hypothetical protein